MKRLTSALIFAVALASLSAPAFSWFGLKPDEDAKDAKPRLHRLLEKAHDLIEQAQEESIAGNGDKAIELYREALKELGRVESENPDRAATPEFAPLRNKAAVCQGAIDAIRFAQVNSNANAVSVTDTTELQKKWKKKHGIKTQEDEKPQDAPSASTNAAVKVQPETPPKATADEKTKTEPAKKVEIPVKPKPANGSFADRRKWAYEVLKSGRYVDADRELEALMIEQPDDLQTLLLRAAAQAGLGSNYAARSTLERAMRYHPKSYFPYYNLASLILKMDKNDINSARQYYELGRALGGPVNPDLEKTLKTKK
jgi:tetratricopeptide (TPR) repeat protein